MICGDCRDPTYPIEVSKERCCCSREHGLCAALIMNDAGRIRRQSWHAVIQSDGRPCRVSVERIHAAADMEVISEPERSIRLTALIALIQHDRNARNRLPLLPNDVGGTRDERVPFAVVQKINGADVTLNRKSPRAVEDQGHARMEWWVAAGSIGF